MLKRILIVAIGLVVLTGCLPIELDVTPDGRVLIPRGEGFFAYHPATGEATEVYQTTAAPVFALSLGEGGGFIAISQPGEGGMMGAQMTIERVNAAGKASRVHSASNITYAQVSPDGGKLSFTRLADQQSEGFDQNLPELGVVGTDGGAVTKLAANVGITHRWLPDGRSLVVMKLDSKDGESDTYAGRIALVDAGSGELTDLASVVGPQGVFLDLSPDGKRVLFTAYAADAPGAELDMPDGNDQPATKLFELDIEGKSVKEVWPEAKFAMYSPKQTKVLIGGPGDDNLVELIVTDAKFAGQTVVANDAAGQIGGMGPSTDIYPTWYDDQTVLFLAKQAVYGTAGENLMLATVKADGSDRRSHQANVDAAAAK